MKIFLTIVITLAVLIIIGLAFMYSGVYNVAAINPPGNLESWFFSTVMDNSVEHHSDGIKAPALDGAAMIDSGFPAFQQNVCRLSWGARRAANGNQQGFESGAAGSGGCGQRPERCRDILGSEEWNQNDRYAGLWRKQ